MYGPALVADDTEPVGSAKRIVGSFFRLVARKIHGVFPPVVLRKDRSFLFQGVVQRGFSNGTAGVEVLVGIDPGRTVLVPEPRACPGVFSVGVVTESRNVPKAQVHRRFTFHDPGGQLPADTRSLVEPGHDARGTEVVSQCGVGPQERAQVRGKDHRPIDDSLDAHFAQAWHALNRLGQVVLHSFEVVRQQFVTEIERRSRLRPVRAPVFIGAKKHAGALLPGIHVCLRKADFRHSRCH